MLRNLYGEQRKAAPYKKVTKKLLRAQQQLAWEDEAEQAQADIQLAVTSTVAAQIGRAHV